jgi:GNAT superfamily N-acetyltransferase
MTAPHVAIASATHADCPACAELLVAQLAEHQVIVTAAQLLPILEKAVADPNLGFLIVARDQSQIIGVAYAASLLSAEHCGVVCSLEELYVSPAARSRGVGSALLGAVLETAKARGMIAVLLEVDAAHQKVLSLYQRFGFRNLDRTRWSLGL